MTPIQPPNPHNAGQFLVQEISAALRRSEYAQVRRQLQAIVVKGPAILPDQELGVALYNLACLQSRMAQQWTGSETAKNRLLNLAVWCLKRWFEHVLSAHLLNREDAIRYARDDDDLVFLRAYREKELRPLLTQEQPKKEGIAGCVATETHVLTPDGFKAAGALMPGDTVLSTWFPVKTRCISAFPAQVVRTAVSVQDDCVSINGQLHCSPRQRVLISEGGWTAAHNLSEGMQLVQSDGQPVVVHTIHRCVGRLEVVGILTDHCSHNFFANGLLCHNNKM